MRPTKPTRPKKSTHPPPSPAAAARVAPIGDDLQGYRFMLWAVFFGTSLFLWPTCLDRYLVPRFFFLSAVLLVSVGLLWREWRARGELRLPGFDLLLLGWYGLNAASITWAHSWSEAVFFTQKVLLLFGTYWLLRQALLRNEAMVRRTLHLATTGLTFITAAILLGQLFIAVSRYGLNNEQLYDYASGISGNKGLASDFLFFLLIFNLLFYEEFRRKWLFWLSEALLLGLIFVLQTRTVYLAVVGAGLFYFPGRAILDSAFRSIFLKKILPVSLAVLALLIAFVALKGRGNTLAERLNPTTYLESASANERRFIWYKTDLLNADHYWWGVGNGSWKFWLPSKGIGGGYRLEEKNIIFTRAHNDYLEVRAEMGMVGAVLFILLFVAAFASLAYALIFQRKYDTAQYHSPPEDDYLESTSQPISPSTNQPITIAASLFGYCIIQYFDFPRERLEMQMMLGVLFAHVAFYGRGLWAKLPGFSLQKLLPAFLGLMVLGLVFNLVIGYHRIVGEIHNVRLLQAQAANRPAVVLREAAATQNAFYEYNDVGLPIKWYEGIIHFQQNDFDKSVAAFEEAYRLNPWSFQVLNNYASALTKKGDYDRAIQIFEQAVTISPRYDEGKFNLSYVWYQKGDYQKSLEWLSRVDTIRNPQTEDERTKNRLILQRQAEFRKVIQEKVGAVKQSN